MIFEAIKENNIKAIIDFIHKGNDVNIQDKEYTPLQYSIIMGNLGITLLLIECGARYDSLELINFAEQHNQHDIAQALRLII